MYVPSYFDENRAELLHDLIQKHPFGTLVTHTNNILDANHLPFHLHPDQGKLGVLICHVARNNPIWQELKNNDQVLAIFQAANAYISPNWYPSKQEQHHQVPTWNYQVVHAHGRVTIHDDEKFVRGVVARLTRTHEASQPKPWKMTDSSPDYIDAMLKNIVGIEIEITRLVGKFKLSQNKEARDMVGAAEGLKATGESEISGAMLSAVKDKAG